MQIVGYEPTPEAALLVSDGGVLERMPLARGHELGLSLGERHCGGSVSGDEHRPCDRPDTPRCAEHTETWICARCRGECLKPTPNCRTEHVVYLAIVAPDHCKVGVTRAGRFHTRLHEQGADRGAMIHQVADGRIAREIEADLGEKLPERIPISAKIRGLTRTVDERSWSELLADHQPIEECHPSYSLELPGPPVPDTLASGRVCGTKGRLLLLAFGETTYVVDLRSLVGYRVVEGSPSTDLQAGLGAFS